MINFILSLDYELGWGTFDKARPNYLTRNVANSTKAASQVFATNEELRIPATWAVVGLMFPGSLDFREKVELLDRKYKKEVPAHDVFSRFDKDTASKLLEMPTGFVKKIMKSTCQEFASHTFSHFYSLSVDEALMRDDFQQMCAVFDEIGEKGPVSLVMPKNQVTVKVIDFAKEYGIKIIRVNPCNWLYSTRVHGSIESKVIRALRFLDAFLPVNEMFYSRSYSLDIHITEGNFHFRPNFRFKLLNLIHFGRFKLLLFICRLKKRDVHMWSHPHNFGRDIEGSLRNYKRMLEYVLKLNAAGKIGLINMSRLAN